MYEIKQKNPVCKDRVLYFVGIYYLTSKLTLLAN